MDTEVYHWASIMSGYERPSNFEGYLGAQEAPLFTTPKTSTEAAG